jgi:myo-inositol-1(or 4)-monophosphatase
MSSPSPSSSPRPASRSIDVELAITAALAAGAGIMQSFGSDLKVTFKSPDQPLTEADLAADRLLTKMLMSARPGYGWLSEETADNPRRLELANLWVVDPIDGTRSFIAHRPEFSISIALAERGEPVVGVIHNPATGELYWSVRGGGAWERTASGDVRLAVRATSSHMPLLIASRSEISRGAFDAFSGSWEVRGIGSTAYKMALVAAGKADAFLSRGPKSEWDVCAGALIVEEAGGVATDADGGPLVFNRADTSVKGILVATQKRHSAILKEGGGE